MEAIRATAIPSMRLESKTDLGTGLGRTPDGQCDWVKFFLDAKISQEKAEEYAQKFRTQAIEEDALKELDNNWLNLAGITLVGDQIKIVAHAKSLLGISAAKNRPMRPRLGVKATPYTRSLLSALPNYGETGAIPTAEAPAAVAKPAPQIPKPSLPTQPVRPVPTVQTRGLRSSSEVLFLLEGKKSVEETSAMPSGADGSDKPTLGAHGLPHARPTGLPMAPRPGSLSVTSAAPNPLRSGFSNLFNLLGKKKP